LRKDRPRRTEQHQPNDKSTNQASWENINERQIASVYFTDYLKGGKKILFSLFLVNTALLEVVEVIVNVFSLVKSSLLRFLSKFWRWCQRYTREREFCHASISPAKQAAVPNVGTSSLG